jgi:hypothetical protein
MRPSFCRPSTSPGRNHTRPSWISRLPWLPSRPRNRAIAPSCPPPCCATACCPTLNTRPSSMPARRMARILRDRGPSMRPATWSRPHPMMLRTQSASVVASSSVTARARARAGSLLGSSSTTGPEAVARRSGYRRALWGLMHPPNQLPLPFANRFTRHRTDGHQCSNHRLHIGAFGIAPDLFTDPRGIGLMCLKSLQVQAARWEPTAATSECMSIARQLVTPSFNRSTTDGSSNRLVLV